MKKSLIILTCLLFLGCAHTQLTRKQLMDNLHKTGSLSDAEYEYLQLLHTPETAEISYKDWLSVFDMIVNGGEQVKEAEQSTGQELTEKDREIAAKCKDYIQTEKMQSLNDKISMFDFIKEVRKMNILTEDEYSYSLADYEKNMNKDQVLHYEDILIQTAEKLRTGNLDETERVLYEKLYRLTEVEYKKAILQQEQSQRTYDNTLKALFTISKMSEASKK